MQNSSYCCKNYERHWESVTQPPAFKKLNFGYSLVLITLSRSWSISKKWRFYEFISMTTFPLGKRNATFHLQDSFNSFENLNRVFLADCLVTEIRLWTYFSLYAKVTEKWVRRVSHDKKNALSAVVEWTHFFQGEATPWFFLCSSTSSA